MFHSALGMLAIGACLVLSTTPGWCEENKAAVQEASARFKAGMSYGYQGKWEKARLSFVQAYAILPTPSTLWNLALAELKSGHPLEALEHFDAYEQEPRADQTDKAMLPTFRDRAFNEIGRITIVSPGGATVWVDGAIQDVAKEINLLPGEHMVKVRLDQDEEQQRLTIVGGQRETLSFDVGAHGSRSAIALATTAPTVAPNEVLPQAAEPSEKSASTSRRASSLTWGWIGVGATAGALAVGIGYAAAAAGKANGGAATPTKCNADPTAEACNDAHDSANKHDSYLRASAVGFVSAGVLGVASAAYFIVVSGTRGSVAVTPYAGPRQGGVTFRTEF